jgi:hypothetical protein
MAFVDLPRSVTMPPPPTGILKKSSMSDVFPSSSRSHRQQCRRSTPLKIPSRLFQINNNSLVGQSSQQQHQQHEAERDAEQEQMRQEADYRDYMFYSRVLLGVQRTHSNVQSPKGYFENQRCLQNIISTRYHDDVDVNDNKNIDSSTNPSYHASDFELRKRRSALAEASAVTTTKTTSTTTTTPTLRKSPTVTKMLWMPSLMMASQTPQQENGDFYDDDDDDGCIFDMDL